MRSNPILDGNRLPNLGKQIRLWRLAKKMTQSELETAAGLSHNAVSRIECSSVSPRLGTIERISQALDVSVEQLQFQKPMSPPPHTESSNEWEERLNKLINILERVPEPRRSKLLGTFLDLVRINIDETDE